jgi:hypothetical protein
MPSTEQHISVVPNISGHPTRHARRSPQSDLNPAKMDPAKMDPDVRLIMETGGDDFNVHSMPHKKTQEESASEGAQKITTSSWAIIAMAIVVIILICAITYLVIKYNEPAPPASLAENLQRKPVARVIRKPTQPNNVPAEPDPTSAKKKGSKEELLSILKRTKPRESDESSAHETEGSGKSTDSAPGTHTGGTHADDRDTEGSGDDQMVQDFYKQMQDNTSTDSTPEQTNAVVQQLIDRVD